VSNLSFSFAPDVRPLAARLRPRHLHEYVGQQHLLGAGMPLRKAIELGQLSSLIFWGPPGSGKTSLAELIASHTDAAIEKISAVTAGIKEIREAIEHARMQLQQGRRTLLFVDEVHRFNKAQQDAFLPHIEDGTVLFIGATTENPSFALNNALLSRARVFVLQKIPPEALGLLVHRALTDTELGLGNWHLSLTEQAQQLLLQLADGDARRLLNLLEMAAQSVGPEQKIDVELLKQLAERQLPGFDNQGELYYDLISAFHKSVRGSNPDAALYWYCRILEGGGDPLYVARRLLAIASEDIGNADPRALNLALAAFDTFQRVGPAEGERAIAQAAVYCALAPKSNALYSAFNQMRELVRTQPAYAVPMHLRNAPTTLLKELGYGEGYRYAHDEPGAYAAGMQCLPDELVGRQFYQPTERGLEKQLAEKLAYLQQLDAQATAPRQPDTPDVKR